MRRPAAVPEALGSAFTTAQARAVRFPRSSFDQPLLAHPHRGVHLVAHDDDSPSEALRRDVLHRARACVLALPPGAFFCGVTAAIFLRFPLPIALEREHTLEVAVFHPDRAPRGRGMVARQVRPHLASETTIDGLRTTSPASTWAMLAPRLELDDLIAVGDAVVRIPRHPGGFAPPERPPLATPAQLRAAVDAGTRAGIGRLREALPLIRTGSASRSETKTRLLIARAGLPTPQLDVDVYSDAGRFLGCSELAYPDLRVAVECEGDHHRTSKRQWNRDIDKYADYEEAGWAVVRLTSALVWDRPAEGIRRIIAALKRQGWRP